MKFRWNDWNLEHLWKHGVVPDEVDFVINHAGPFYPEKREDDKWLVWDPTAAGRFLQVIYLHDPDSTVYVIHARPLTEHEKRQYRRRKR